MPATMRKSLLLFLALGMLASTGAAMTIPNPIHTPDPLQPGYFNRIVLIRHAEKGHGGTTIGPGPSPAQGQGDNGSDRPQRPPWGPPRGGGGRGGRGGGGQGGHGGPGGPGGPGGKMPNGLSDVGKERAQWIRTLFGASSEYNFGLIFAAPRDEVEKDTERTYATVAPLAKDLGLEINIECANAEASCIVSAIEQFAETSDADILISWKHFDLNIIATALGAPNAKQTYPGDRHPHSSLPLPILCLMLRHIFPLPVEPWKYRTRTVRVHGAEARWDRNDLIWIMQSGTIVEKRSMHCPGIDDERKDEGDPDLEVEEPRPQPQSSPVGAVPSWLGLLGRIGQVWRAQTRDLQGVSES
ncbi:hypothetical protein EHS25_000729 [Saitozyma podzolica]|uniref:Uncharacterized protein n=1 Tax=Saitozyma podzolica TaxID=1890683 RepID=A0A427YX31_9TREE|nr:hypothetical protein EHS25_000729 [Saitozyma podzolica]